jgi:hypothetical protein
MFRLLTNPITHLLNLPLPRLRLAETRACPVAAPKTTQD